MGNIRQIEVLPETALTVSGGATPAVTTAEQRIGGHSFGDSVGLVLVNSGPSTGLSVTFQRGYLITGKDESVQWITPALAITNLTSQNIPSGAVYGSQALNVCDYIRFIATNEDAINTATVRLIMFIQV